MLFLKVISGSDLFEDHNELPILNVHGLTMLNKYNCNIYVYHAKLTSMEKQGHRNEYFMCTEMVNKLYNYIERHTAHTIVS